MLGLITELIKRGEKVVVYSSDSYKNKIFSLGAFFRDYGKTVNNAIEKLYRNTTFKSLIDYIIISSGILPDLLHDIDTDKPDYIIFDSMNLIGKYIADITGLPSISSYATLASNPAKKGLFMTTLFEKVIIHTKYLNDVLRYKKFSNEIHSKYGIGPYYLSNIYSNPGKFSIVYTSRMFHPYIEAFDSSFHFIGPAILKRNDESDFPFEKLKNKKVVYISFGTIFNDLFPIYQKCINAFKDTNFTVIMSIGNKVNKNNFKNIPDNIMIFDHVPQIEILKKADLFITHAGMNSINESLYFFVPLVCIPIMADQNDIANRIVELDAGVRLSKKNLSVTKIKNAVMKVINNEKYKKNCELLGNSLRNSRGLIEIFEKLSGFIEKDKSIT